jgi:CRISPR-associated endonuclease/helicase Cas3
VDLLARTRVNQDELENALEHYPVRAHERLREPTNRIREKLRKLAATNSEAEPVRVICILRNGDVRPYTLGDLAESDVLEYATVLLPPGCGAIERGMFRPAAGSSDDVADRTRNPEADPMAQREAYHAKRSDGEWTFRKLGTTEIESPAIDVEEFVKRSEMKEARVRIPAAEGDGEGPEEYLIYLTKKKEKQPAREISLSGHTERVSALAKRMAEKAGLGDLADVFETAGNLHDGGKGDSIWQAAVGGSMENPIAKPCRQFRPGQLGGFRHEFSSVRKEKARACDELTLHLIAAHHGWARPHFRPQAFDRSAIRDSERTALECTQRFGRLQEQYGAWHLAYLEAIFKAADALISEQEKEQPTYA